MYAIGEFVLALVVAALLTFARASEAAVIDFDELGNVGEQGGPRIEDQYASLGVRFSSADGLFNIVTTQPDFNGSKPNFLCTADSGGSLNCTGETVLDFTAPVSGLSFDALGVNDVRPDVAQIDVFENGAFSATVVLDGNGESYEPLHVDLGAFSGVTRVRLYAITDAGGIGWDTFRFSVPEPALPLLLGAALAAAVALRRCQRVTAVTRTNSTR